MKKPESKIYRTTNCLITKL